MTKERFRIINHDDYELDYIADSQQSFKKLDLYDCCDLLNEQYKENNKLKKEIKELEEFRYSIFKRMNELISKEEQK